MRKQRLALPLLCLAFSILPASMPAIAWAVESSPGAETFPAIGSAKEKASDAVPKLPEAGNSLAPAKGGELKALNRGDFARIKEQYKGQPFIVILWGVDCPHCKHVLPQLHRFTRKYPAARLVVISTDSFAEQEMIQQVLAKAGLGNTDTWVFNDAMTERLRYEIDPQWRGEMPRIYLFNHDLGATAISGSVNNRQLQAWLKKQKSLRNNVIRR